MWAWFGVRLEGDNTTLVATGFLLPLVGFLRLDDGRVCGTVDAVQDRLVDDDALVRRCDDAEGFWGLLCRRGSATASLNTTTQRSQRLR